MRVSDGLEALIESSGIATVISQGRFWSLIDLDITKEPNLALVSIE